MNDKMPQPLKYLWVVWLFPIAALCYLLAPILTPFVVAALLAYLGNPWVNRLVRHKLPRTWAVSLIFIVLISLITGSLLVLLPSLEQQINRLLQALPTYLNWIQHTIVPHLQALLPADLPTLDTDLIRQAIQAHWQQIGGVISGLWGSVAGTGLRLMHWLTNLILIPILTFYLLRDWEQVITGIQRLIPRHRLNTIQRLAYESDAVLGKFIRGQLMVMIALAVIYTSGLWIVGLEFALLIGLIAGAVSFVPYLGLIIGLLIAGIASILQNQGIGGLPLVALVFIIAQVLESTVLTPRFVGENIGLHPVAVIFAVLAGGQLYGFIGILIALPVAAVVMVLIRELIQRYQHSTYYTGLTHGQPRCT